MKTLKIIKPLAVLSILSVVGSTAFGGPQRVEQAPPQKGERYAYVWLVDSRIPQKVKISPIGTLAQSPLSEYDRRQVNWTRGGTVKEALSNEPTLSFRGH